MREGALVECERRLEASVVVSVVLVVVIGAKKSVFGQSSTTS